MKFKRKKKQREALNPIEAAFLNLYSEEELKLLKSHEPGKLELIVAEMGAHVMKAKKDMESNPDYVAAKEKLDVFRGAFNDTKKFAFAKKHMCLLLLQKHGIVDCGEEDDV
jgi:hypothetical protein